MRTAVRVGRRLPELLGLAAKRLSAVSRCIPATNCEAFSVLFAVVTDVVAVISHFVASTLTSIKTHS